MNAHPHHNTPPAADNDTAPLEAVTGTVESIVFRNDETGYTVCSVKTHGGGVRQRDTVVTIVGSCATVWEGEELHAEGQWIRHPSHGQRRGNSRIRCGRFPCCYTASRHRFRKSLIRKILCGDLQVLREDALTNP